jgi:hypothetical protein
MSATVKQYSETPAAALWRVAEAGEVDKLDGIFSRGADVNVRNKYGTTALMKAACNGHERMVHALLTRGANPNLKRNDKFTALALAAFFGHTETVRTLIEHGANTGTITRCGASALTWATSRTCDEAAHFLESHTPAAVEPAPVRAVKTLKDPPEIWDLVQEVPRGFNARSAFMSRLESMKTSYAVGAAVVVVSVACVLGVWTWRRSQGRALPVSNPASQAVVASEVSKTVNAETTASQDAFTATAPGASELSHHSPANDDDKRARKLIWTRPVRSRSPAVEEPAQSVQSREAPVAAPVVATPQSEPRQPSKPNNALSPQLITPAKSAPPKAKVIRWP